MSHNVKTSYIYVNQLVEAHLKNKNNFLQPNFYRILLFAECVCIYYATCNASSALFAFKQNEVLVVTKNTAIT